MRLCAGLILFLVPGLSPYAAEKPAAPGYLIESVSVPGTSRAMAPVLSTSPDGTVWLTWIDANDEERTIRCVAFDATGNRWLEPRTIAVGRDIAANAAEPPALTAGPGGNLTASWKVTAPGGHQHLVYRSSSDAGRTWRPILPLTRESSANKSVALTTLADGRVLAAWLDDRATTNASPATRLYARILDIGSGPTSLAKDQLIDSRVCAGSAPAISPFPDGGALVAYRGRDADDIRDILVARFTSAWSQPRLVNADRWRTSAAPANGARLAIDGGRVAAVWFTSADREPRMQLSTSPDAGGRFLLPLKVDHGSATGLADVVILHDGSALATWIEGASTDSKTPAGIWLRRASPQFALDAPVLLAAAAATEPSGFPRAVVLHDFTGDRFTAQLLVAYQGRRGIEALRVTVPEAELLATTADTCNCLPPIAQLVGFPIRGKVTAASTNGEITVTHPEFPGIFPAGTHRFRAGPSVIASLPPGGEFLGLIEKRGDAWWLFDVRRLGAEAK